VLIKTNGGGQGPAFLNVAFQRCRDTYHPWLPAPKKYTDQTDSVTPCSIVGNRLANDSCRRVTANSASASTGYTPTSRPRSSYTYDWGSITPPVRRTSLERYGGPEHSNGIPSGTTIYCLNNADGSANSTSRPLHPCRATKPTPCCWFSDSNVIFSQDRHLPITVSRGSAGDILESWSGQMVPARFLLRRFLLSRDKERPGCPRDGMRLSKKRRAGLRLLLLRIVPLGISEDA